MDGTAKQWQAKQWQVEEWQLSDRATRERAACGIGLVADVGGHHRNRVLRMALEALANLAHRGAVGADGTTTDGTGVLTQIPWRLLRLERPEIQSFEQSELAVACLFLPPEGTTEHAPTRRLVEQAFLAGELSLLAWRQVPVDPTALGYLAAASCPEIVQVILRRPPELATGAGDASGDEALGEAFERHLYLVRRRLEKAAAEAGLDELAVVSMSHRTVIYKSMAEASRLPDFYPDLRSSDYETAVALFHQRFSTNTQPTWRLAQPFRLLAHNGEINTVQGNFNWMRTREPQFASQLWGENLPDLLPVLEADDSDSAMLDKALEFLLRSGRELEHGLSMLLPPALRHASASSDAVRAFFEYHALLIEPWDGPAAIVATDGVTALAGMDRNGLRPLRTWQTRDDLMIIASEAGVVSLPETDIVAKGRLGPGQMLAIDLARGTISGDAAIKQKLAAARPYRQWLEGQLELPPATSAETEPSLDAARRRILELAFGYTTEALDRILEPMAHGKLPIGSMGNDAPLALLSEQPQLLFSYFKQRFAQVTNPPIDPLRERLVFELDAVAGGVANLLDGEAEAAHLARFPSPVLSTCHFEWLLGLEDPAFRHRELDLTWTPPGDPAEDGEALRLAVERLVSDAVAAARDGVPILVLTDRGLGKEKPTIPILLATAAVHSRLVGAQERMRVTLVCDTAEPREDHHVACLLGFGATLVHPYLAYSAVARRGRRLGLTTRVAIANYRSALDQGLLKILSRLGVCPMISYHGAQLFEALGLDRDLIDAYFPGTPSRLGGAGFAHLAADVLELHQSAFAGDVLPDRGLFRFRRGGEHHDLQPKAFTALHRAVREQDAKSFSRYSSALDNGRPSRLRHLLGWKPLAPPIALDEVEGAEHIVRRFATAAMSLGALSQEAHEALAVAMNKLRGLSNSGEGGEDPIRFTPYRQGETPKLLGAWQPRPGDLASSAIKQIASGRFGVTAHYLSSAREIEIKMAQGSKPGEGGQIPGHKVTAEIARLRRSTPGVALISPPPHHDIYSIEDLAQLIHDLKRVNEQARIGVKLVSLAGVGTIACGVVKAHADYILISGDDGGTGASPLSSIKHAGMPWELGLAETQQQLVANDLRQRVTLRVDGGLRTGRDVVAAALLGAEEFGFGTAPLIALGCVMARQCHNNTCPVGIATQQQELRAKFPGQPEHVIRFLSMVAAEVREILASMGARRLDDLIGRFDLLIPRDDERVRELGLHLLDLCRDPDPSGIRARRRRLLRNSGRSEGLDDRLATDGARQLQEVRRRSLSYTITNRDRTVGARLAGQIARTTGGEGLEPGSLEVRFEGAAGQSFGAFMVRGMDFCLRGEAQDGVGKGMSGGQLVLRPASVWQPDTAQQVIAGNAMLYGATGGELYAAGRVGERFCVRNSGAAAVVEGCGDHGCEYMTAGLALVLGPVGRNFGAGMSGGKAYLYDPAGLAQGLLNPEMVGLGPLEAADLDTVESLLAKHVELTGSLHGRGMLDRWPETRRDFVAVLPSPALEAVGATDTEPADSRKPAEASAA